MSRLLSNLLTMQAERRPDATAVVMGPERLSYAELDEASSRLAGCLAARGVGPGSRVCILLPKSPTAIVSIFGILKAGASYVPLDPDNPAARTGRMLRSSDDRFLLTSAKSLPLLSELISEPPSHGEWCVGWLDDENAPAFGAIESFTMRDVRASPAETRASGRSPDDIAYIMFTSGSTGVPKGVTITHANVLAFIDWAVPYFGIGPGDRSSSHPPLHFDLSVFDIFGTIAAGAELHLVPKSVSLLPAPLARFIRDSALTQWFSVPSVLNYMMNADCVAPGDFPALQRLLWCGEVLPTPTLRYFMERLPHVRFTNLYGPTEATIASSYHTVPALPANDRDDIPIGLPCAGEELLVLDEALAPVPPGEIGELYIGGVGLSPGYWRDADKTAAAFKQTSVGGATRRIYRTGDLAWTDADGEVHYVGRADSQIKSRGYRIELGEIEAALRTLDELDEAAVVAIRSEGFEGWTICAAYVPTTPGGTDPSRITEELRRALPAYMIPQRWAEYERLPTNSNGKVDRPQLRTAFESKAAVVR
jgi:amino acid adenylation domain-containing protein